MNLFRIVFLSGALLATGGAAYFSYNGIWRESADIDRSVRLGSGGGGYYSNSSVK